MRQQAYDAPTRASQRSDAAQSGTTWLTGDKRDEPWATALDRTVDAQGQAHRCADSVDEHGRAADGRLARPQLATRYARRSPKVRRQHGTKA